MDSLQSTSQVVGVEKASVTNESEIEEIERLFAQLASAESTRSEIETIRVSWTRLLKAESSLSEQLNRVVKNHAQMKSMCARAAEVDKQAKWSMEAKLERAWRQAAEAKSRAKKMKLLTSEIYFLGKLIVQDVGIEMGQERSLVDVVREKELAEKRCQMLTAEIDKLGADLEREKTMGVDLSRRVEESVEASRLAEQKLLEASVEKKRLERELESARDRLREQKRAEERKDELVEELNGKIGDLRDEIVRHEKQTREHRVECERLEREIRSQQARIHTLMNEIDTAVTANSRLVDRRQQLEGAVKEARAALERGKIEASLLRKSAETSEARARAAEEERSRESGERRELEMRVERLSREVAELDEERRAAESRGRVSERELDKSRRQLDRARGEIERLRAELDTVRVELNAARNEVARLVALDEVVARQRASELALKQKIVSSGDVVRRELDESQNEIKRRELAFQNLKKGLFNVY